MRTGGWFERDERKFEAGCGCAAELQGCGHGKRSGPNHGPERVGDGETDAMPAGKNPTGEMKFDGKRINMAGIEGGWARTRVALRATLACTGDHGHGSVGGDV